MRQKGNRRARREDGGTTPPAPRTNLYDDVTRRIISELEAGRFPWVQPWGRAGSVNPGLPRNAVTSRHYSGVNVLILWGAVIENGHPSQSWLTFRQAREAGGNVRKGEHGVTVVYADRFTPEAEKERARHSGDEAKAIPFLKRFTVFNVAQCEGLRPGLAADPAPLPERQIVPVAEEVIAASGVDFRIGGDQAFYVPSEDFVQVPPQPAFFEQINYYRTALHELTHATGHASRLGRTILNDFGSKNYAREELVAEMGSAFLCAALGIVPTVRHADSYGVLSVNPVASRHLTSSFGDRVLRGELGWLSLNHAAQDKLIYGRRWPNPDPSYASRPSSEAVGPFYHIGRSLEPNRRSVTHRPRSPQRHPLREGDAEFLNIYLSNCPQPRAIGHQAIFDEAPQGDQQLTGERDNPDLSCPRPNAGSLLEPLCQFALWLITQPEPGKFDAQIADPDVAGLGDTLFALPCATRIRGWGESGEGCELAAVIESAVKCFTSKNGRRLCADPMQTMKPLRDDDHLVVSLAYERIVPHLLDRLQLFAHDVEALDLANQLREQARRQAAPITRSQSVKALGLISTHRVKVVNALRRQQALDAINVLVLLAPQTGSFAMQPLGVLLLHGGDTDQSAGVAPAAVLRFDSREDGDDVELIGLAMLGTPLDLKAGRINDPASYTFLCQRAVNPETVVTDLEADEDVPVIDAILTDQMHEVGQVAPGDSVSRNLRSPFNAKCHDPRATAQFQRDKQVWFSLNGHDDPPLQSVGEEAILAPREHHPHGIYLGCWLDVLREDNRAIFRAASAASKAADWILARYAETQDGEGRRAA